MKPPADPVGSWVAYVGPFPFPWGEASSRRVYGIARGIAATGRRVVVVAGGTDKSELRDLEDDGAVSWVGTGELGSRASKFAKAMRTLVTGGRGARRWIASQPTLPSTIIVYGGSLPYFLTFRRWCRKNKVAFVIDVVEWYDPTHVLGGRFGPYSFASALEHRVLHRSSDGVIVISTYLENYYASKGLKPLLVQATASSSTASSGTVELAEARSPGAGTCRGSMVRVTYFGFAGKKDELQVMLDAAAAVPMIHLTVAGPSEVAVVASADPRLKGRLTALGHVPHDLIADIVRASDFTTFLRKPTRSNQAGFPTKFVESLSLGVPVITNSTSDIGMYLSDGENGLLVEDESGPALASAFRRAAELSVEVRASMRDSADAAGRSISWTRSVESLGYFLDELENKEEAL